MFRKNKNEKVDRAIIEFDDHDDDSSDEEQVASALSAFNANKQWLALQDEIRVKTKSPLDNDHLLSFAAHAAANQFYHSKQIGDLYYNLKRGTLNSKAETLPSSKKLSGAILSAVKKSMIDTFANLKKFITIATTDKSVITDLDKKLSAVSSLVQGRLTDQVEASLPAMITYIKAMRLSKKNANTPIEEAKSKISEVEASILDIVSSTCKSEMKFPKDSGMRPAVMIQMNNMLQEKIDDIFTLMKFGAKRNLKGKEEALAALADYHGPYRDLVKALTILLESCAANGKVSTMLESKIEGNQDLLLMRYLSDLIAIKENRVAGGVLSKVEAELFQKYFSYDSGSIDDEFRRTFSVTLSRHIYDVLHSFQRSTLGSTYEFVSDHPFRFYANLRLSNRSQKRSILNSKAKFFKNDSVVRTWKINSSERPAVVEQQNLTNETLGRRDLVLGLSNYEKIYHDLLAIKARLNELSVPCDEKLIATWLRAAFLGESNRIAVDGLCEAERLSMEEMLDRVAYLIHGCEAARNIAMIVIVPMLLDLVIETDEWTLAEAFTGRRGGEEMGLKARLMPMVPEGAVAAARSLESSYHGYVPHRYHYPGNQDFDGSGYKMRKEELVKYEARVVRAWLQLKYGKDLKVTNAEASAWVVEAIHQHIGIWFEKSKNARVAP